MDLMTRRRALLERTGSAPIIGYKAGYNLNGDGLAELENGDFFVTGFIPFTATNGVMALTAVYSDKGFMQSNMHFVAFYNSQQEPVHKDAYYDMTRANERTVRNTSVTLTSRTAYIRFVGRIDSVNSCYIKDDINDKILWQKGM